MLGREGKSHSKYRPWQGEREGRPKHADVGVGAGSLGAVTWEPGEVQLQFKYYVSYRYTV